MPSTGLVSAPLSTPEYSKVQVVDRALGHRVGRMKRTVELLVRRSVSIGLLGRP